MEIVTGVLVQSLILSIMVLGVYISYKILDFPDMSADGSFTLGAAIIAIMLKKGVSPIIGMLFALLAGLIAGLLTGVLHVKLKISNLLSGILVMGILYSLNLRIMGKANIPIFSKVNIFYDFNPLVITFVFVVIVKVLIDIFLKTGLGYTLKGVGDNPQMIKSLGIEVGRIKILGLMLSNGLIALSGSIMAQYQGFSDVSMGMGTLVLGIASIIIGTSIIKKKTLIKESTLVIMGTLIYQITIYFAMNIGLTPVDLKMITSLVLIIFLAVSEIKNNQKRKDWKWIRNVKNSKLIKKLS
ncbi:ABC transporter permease [Clostridium algidicarnis]|uniref:ABC transporter permease n=1 Tax=Clostridium algidicarnis TaxID=37659 RepID=UPI001C0B9A0C|nr:ABC transporter permease [Clostridium algidicarnis]MBU3204360.1 ABC transporter permease [Clostridium algidicarnis]MBU3206497.1 ABC transporter permease [Clostridium algidicarnis]MBU3212556.1 ABC transporter permease [Clostridium algidicarnis]MBU3222987.1 ABC transporter permease [Clostridium algidicarnis]